MSYYAKAWQVFNPNRPLDCYTLMKPSFCYMFKNKSYYHHNANDLFEFNLFSNFQLPFAHRSPFFCSIVMANILVVATSKVWWCDNKVLMIRQQISTCLSLTYWTESKVDTRSDWTQRVTLNRSIDSYKIMKPFL